MDTTLPNSTPASAGLPIRNSGIANLLSRMPENARRSFSAEQIQWLEEAAEETKWRWHPVNLRFSLPAFLGRYYCVVVAGKERRSAERRRQERVSHPMGTLGNMLFLAGLAAVGTVVGSVVFAQLLVWFLADKL